MPSSVNIDRLHGFSLAVNPFVIGPSERLNSECRVLAGPSTLAEYAANIQDVQYSAAKNGTVLSPIVAQVFYRKRAIYAVATCATKIEEQRSGRRGQQIVLGLIVDPRVFACHRRVLATSFERFDRWVGDAFGHRIDSGGIDDFALKLQDPEYETDQLLPTFSDLLQELEQFSCDYRERLTFRERLALRRRTRTLLGKRRTHPSTSWSRMMAYWRYVDGRLHPSNAPDPIEY
jgi:hypothetical protein